MKKFLYLFILLIIIIPLSIFAVENTERGQGERREKQERQERREKEDVPTRLESICKKRIEISERLPRVKIPERCLGFLPEPPVDMCANIEGIQPEVPEGLEKVGENCVEPEPEPVDVCLNIDGVQEEVPEGLVKVGDDCVEPEPEPTDVCANIDGVQETVPEGLVQDGENCVEPTPGPTDVCANIEGVQETVPEGLIQDGDDCVNPPEPTDLCANIDGVQETVPEGLVRDGENCVEPTPPALDHLIISEVYYLGASANEWFEVYNNTGGGVTLDGWTVSDGNSSDVIPTFTLANQSFAIITGSTTISSFLNIPGGVQVIILPNISIGSGLNETGDLLSLKNASAIEIDALNYGNVSTVFAPSIPVVTAGHSLSRISLTIDSNSAADWQDSTTPTPGI